VQYYGTRYYCTVLRYYGTDAATQGITHRSLLSC
jgi:hypothetical protein